MEQPGWIGKLRIAGLYLSGVIVGALGSGICEQKYAIGSSAATYALIMAHMGKVQFFCQRALILSFIFLSIHYYLFP